jgi:hypothetical protein
MTKQMEISIAENLTREASLNKARIEIFYSREIALDEIHPNLVSAKLIRVWGLNEVWELTNFNNETYRVKVWNDSDYIAD